MKTAPTTVSGTLTLDGAVVRHTTEGRGTPLLVLGSSIYYPRTFSAGLRQWCRLTFVDARHFAAETVATGDLEQYIADVEQIRVALGMDRFVLVGHSHHGNLALAYAKRFPQRVSRLVLIGTPPCGVQRVIEAGTRYWDAHASPERKAILRRNHETVSTEPLRPDQAFVARYVADGPRYWFDPHYDASTLWRGMLPLDMAAIGAFRDLFEDDRFDWNPAEMTAPVLAITGLHDYVVPPTLWDDALPRLPNVSYHRFERSGHTPQLEEPDHFDAVLRDWLASGPAALPRG